MRLTDDDRARLYELYDEGWSRRDIAKKIGCSFTTVANILKNPYDREYRTPKPKYDYQRVEPYNYAVLFANSGILKVGYASCVVEYQCNSVTSRFVKSGAYPPEIGVMIWNAAGDLAQEAYLHVRLSLRFESAKISLKSTKINEWWVVGDMPIDAIVRTLDNWTIEFQDLKREAA
jgi:hypothetical protein